MSDHGNLFTLEDSNGEGIADSKEFDTCYTNNDRMEDNEDANNAKEDKKPNRLDNGQNDAFDIDSYIDDIDTENSKVQLIMEQLNKVTTLYTAAQMELSAKEVELDAMKRENCNLQLNAKLLQKQLNDQMNECNMMMLALKDRITMNADELARMTAETQRKESDIDHLKEKYDLLIKERDELLIQLEDKTSENAKAGKLIEEITEEAEMKEMKMKEIGMLKESIEEEREKRASEGVEQLSSSAKQIEIDDLKENVRRLLLEVESVRNQYRNSCAKDDINRMTTYLNQLNEALSSTCDVSHHCTFCHQGNSFNESCAYCSIVKQIIDQRSRIQDLEDKQKQEQMEEKVIYHKYATKLERRDYLIAILILLFFCIISVM